MKAKAREQCRYFRCKPLAWCIRIALGINPAPTRAQQVK